MYDLDYNKLLRHVDFTNMSGLPDPSWPTTDCMHGWIYDKSKIYSSIVIDVIIIHVPLYSTSRSPSIRQCP
jgi:hypothetical protein